MNGSILTHPTTIRRFNVANVALGAALLGAVLSISVSTARSSEFCSQATLAFMKETLACQLEIISWVEVTFQGKLLEEHKMEYERLIRLRLRNDLSMLKHETVKWMDAWQKYEFKSKSKEMRKRGRVTCLVWTVGDDYPVAELVECELSGYGDYSFSQTFSSRVLGYSNSQKADEQVRSSIRQTIAHIGSDFLEARDLASQ